MNGELQILAPDGVPEIHAGDDLAAIVAAALTLANGDIVLVTSKVVSKAEGRVFTGNRDAALIEETSRIVAIAGTTRIVRNHLGLTMAAAGIDESHIEPGRFALLPADPDSSARSLRSALALLTGCNVAVVITDTSGRAWRVGQTDLAIGAAGLRVVEDLRGRRDHFGTPLRVTLPAVADELASAAELAAGKLTGRPFVRVRGRADLVLAPEDHGAGASSLIRSAEEDLFGYGAREAVVAAMRGGDPAPFGRAAQSTELVDAVREGAGAELLDVRPDGLLVRCAGGHHGVVAIAFAHGWIQVDTDDTADPTPDEVLRFKPAAPV